MIVERFTQQPAPPPLERFSACLGPAAFLDRRPNTPEHPTRERQFGRNRQRLAQLGAHARKPGVEADLVEARVRGRIDRDDWIGQAKALAAESGADSNDDA